MERPQAFSALSTTFLYFFKMDFNEFEYSEFNEFKA